MNFEKEFNELADMLREETISPATELKVLNMQEKMGNQGNTDNQSNDKALTITDEEFRNMGYTERTELKTKHPELYDKLAKKRLGGL